MTRLKRDEAVFEVAKRQHGVVSHRQLAETGMGVSRLRCRRNSGEWLPVLPGVVRMYWAEETFLQRAWAARLWAGPSSVLSHATAATLGGLEGLWPEAAIHLTLPRQFGLPSRPGVTVHRSRGVFASADLEDFEGLPFFSCVRTLGDLGRSVPEEEFLRLVARTLRSGAASSPEVRRLCDRAARRPGTRMLREALTRLALKQV